MQLTLEKNLFSGGGRLEPGRHWDIEWLGGYWYQWRFWLQWWGKFKIHPTDIKCVT